MVAILEMVVISEEPWLVHVVDRWVDPALTLCGRSDGFGGVGFDQPWLDLIKDRGARCETCWVKYERYGCRF
jgi:hypothetical protein